MSMSSKHKSKKNACSLLYNRMQTHADIDKKTWKECWPDWDKDKMIAEEKAADAKKAKKKKPVAK